MMRYVVIVVFGCAFLALFWVTVQTHRLYVSSTPTASIAIGTVH